MGGNSGGTIQPNQGAPFIGGPSDPSYTTDPLIESIKYLSGKMGYGPSAPPTAPMPGQANPPMGGQPSVAPLSSDPTIMPDPLIDVLKYLVGSANASPPNMPKRK